MIYPGDIWLVRRRWLGGRFSADSIETLCKLAHAGFVRPTDLVCAPGDAARTLDEEDKWQPANRVPELAVEFRIGAPWLFSPRVRRISIYILSTLIGLLLAILVAAAFNSAATDDRKVIAPILLLAVCILHAARRTELSVIRSRYEAAVQHSVVFHRLKDGREPTRDELLLELSQWNHTLACRQTLYEIQTVLEFGIALIAFFNLT